MPQHVKIEGLNGLLAAMKKLPPELISNKGGPAKAAMRAGAVVIQKEAKRQVHLGDTDWIHVRDNIVVARDPNPRATDSGATERFLVKVRTKRQAKSQGPGTRNAHWLEFGTEKMAALPFLRPAFEATKEKALAVIVEKLKAGVEAIQRKVGKA